MRFIMIMIPKVFQGGKGKRAPVDFIPPAEAVEKMKKFNDELIKAGFND
jgi:hypothetical protein